MKKTTLWKKIFFVTMFGVSNTYALVDYSETVAVPENQVEKRIRNSEAQNPSRASARSNSPGNGFSLKLASGYESQSMPNDGQFNKNTIDFSLETPVNVYMNARYWMGSAKSVTDARGEKISSRQNGNPEIIFGFNFLQIGTREDLATMDMYAGAELASSSRLANSRTDQIYGLEISKRFMDLGLGLGYELRTTGTPKNSDDLDIGNIQRIKASFGWMVSPDIQFQTDFVTTYVGVGEGNSALLEKVQYSTLAPRLNLKLSSFVNFNMGANFLISRPKSNTDVTGLKINTYAPTGTSLMAGLGLRF